RFQSGGAPLFLISLKAGGTALNLTAADTVIHYDPWWNPAAEAQATDRAHRIGQSRPVFIYKLIAQDSIEEKMLALQEQKRALAAGVHAAAARSPAALTAADLERLLTQ
ncbi:Snf2 family protein, partial [mine drainage metagenome]